jgi:hypothetical protein
MRETTMTMIGTTMVIIVILSSVRDFSVLLPFVVAVFLEVWKRGDECVVLVVVVGRVVVVVVVGCVVVVVVGRCVVVSPRVHGCVMYAMLSTQAVILSFSVSLDSLLAWKTITK